MKLYLHQFLSGTGVFKSKKQVFDALKNREIKVGEKTITNPLYQLKPNKRSVFWNGKPISYISKKTYVLLNKPENYLSSRLTKYDREKGKKSVFELIEKDKSIGEKTKNTLFSVGRLDEDTSGLLMLTNDGVLCSRITNPRHKVEKTYAVVLEKPLAARDVSKLERGVAIDLEEDGKTAKYLTKKCKIRLDKNNRNRLIITILEGRKREVRRMFQTIGNKVVELQRIAIGNLNLAELKIKKGEYALSDKKFIEGSIKS